MKLTMYGIPNCNSVKKAKDFLTAKGITFTFHDYKKKGISDEQLEQWIAQIGWEKVLNKIGTTWRGLSEEEKSSVKDAASAKSLMLAKTSLIKRPLIEDGEGKVLVVGFKLDEYEQLFV